MWCVSVNVIFPRKSFFAYYSAEFFALAEQTKLQDGGEFAREFACLFGESMAILGNMLGKLVYISDSGTYIYVAKEFICTTEYVNMHLSLVPVET